MQVALDSSIIIEYLRTKKGIFSTLLTHDQSEILELIIPSIVLFELWRGSSMKSETEQQIIDDLLSEFPVISINSDIAKSAGELERNGFTRGNDALIAASCLAERTQLATLNPKDFSRVPHLTIWKPS